MDSALRMLINVVVFVIILIIVKTTSGKEFAKAHPTISELGFAAAYAVFSIYVVLIRNGIV